MSERINPEAGTPSVAQAFNFSDRNPVVLGYGGVETAGGLVPSPGAAEQRVTPEGPAVPADAGLKY